jgi:hypothetical protein
MQVISPSEANSWQRKYSLFASNSSLKTAKVVTPARARVVTPVEYTVQAVCLPTYYSVDNGPSLAGHLWRGIRSLELDETAEPAI